MKADLRRIHFLRVQDAHSVPIDASLYLHKRSIRIYSHTRTFTSPFGKGGRDDRILPFIVDAHRQGMLRVG